MEAGSGDERGDQANQIVVHVSGVTQRRGAGGHDGGDLGGATRVKSNSSLSLVGRGQTIYINSTG